MLFLYSCILMSLLQIKVMIIIIVIINNNNNNNNSNNKISNRNSGFLEKVSSYSRINIHRRLSYRPPSNCPEEGS